MAREDKVIIRLTVEVKQKFATIAEEMGMTVSALGSFVIGSFVRQQEKVVMPMQEAMKRALVEAAEKAVRDDGQPVSGASPDTE